MAKDQIVGKVPLAPMRSHRAPPSWLANTPVSPLEFSATIYRKMGIDTNTDPRIRPFIGTAAPVNALV